jgi:hypothetical protein
MPRTYLSICIFCSEPRKYAFANPSPSALPDVAGHTLMQGTGNRWTILVFDKHAAIVPVPIILQ